MGKSSSTAGQGILQQKGTELALLPPLLARVLARRCEDPAVTNKSSLMLHFANLCLPRHALLTLQVISVSNEQLNADTVTAAIQAEGNEGAAYCADVRKASAVADLYKFALEKYGRIDCIINSGVHNAANNGAPQAIVRFCAFALPKRNNKYTSLLQVSLRFAACDTLRKCWACAWPCEWFR